MMQDVTSAHSNVTSVDGSLNATDSGELTTEDNAACQHHSSTSGVASASATEQPVDSSKTTQALIGLNAFIASCSSFFCSD